MIILPSGRQNRWSLKQFRVYNQHILHILGNINIISYSMQLIFPLSWVLIILNNLHLNTAGDILLVDQPIQTCHINWWTMIDTLLLTLQSYPSTLISEFHDLVCPVDPHRATRLKPILPKDHVKTFQWKHPHSGNEGMTLNIPLQFFTWWEHIIGLPSVAI